MGTCGFVSQIFYYIHIILFFIMFGKKLCLIYINLLFLIYKNNPIQYLSIIVYFKLYYTSNIYNNNKGGIKIIKRVNIYNGFTSLTNNRQKPLNLSQTQEKNFNAITKKSIYKFDTKKKVLN